MRHPRLAIDVGVGLERAAAASVLVELLEARTGHQDPVIIQVQRVLHEQRVGA
ncbi:hypothetical protein D3C72_2277650 [compost metagenome]